MISEEELQAITKRLAEAAPDGIADMDAKAARDFIEEDGPVLVTEVRRLLGIVELYEPSRPRIRPANEIISRRMALRKQGRLVD